MVSVRIVLYFIVVPLFILIAFFRHARFDDVIHSKTSDK